MVKDRVTMQELCHHLNIPINRSGFICCPFHTGDRNGSLKIYADPDRGWHCFGCGLGGDVITFARRWYGANFPDTISRLAEDFCIPIPTRQLTKAEKDQMDKKRRERERKRWIAAMEKETIESEYWEALDAYIANQKVLDNQNPLALGYVSEDFSQALIRRDELKYNLDKAEDKRRTLYAGTCHTESTANACRTQGIHG